MPNPSHQVGDKNDSENLVWMQGHNVSAKILKQHRCKNVKMQPVNSDDLVIWESSSNKHGLETSYKLHLSVQEHTHPHTHNLHKSLISLSQC